jgi:hypothetical protein
VAAFARHVLVFGPGCNEVPHPAIGLARRMEVPSPKAQHDVLLQAVQNHAPHVVIVDEVGSAKVGTQVAVCCAIFVPVRIQYRLSASCSHCRARHVHESPLLSVCLSHADYLCAHLTPG